MSKYRDSTFCGEVSSFCGMNKNFENPAKLSSNATSMNMWYIY